MLSYVSGEEALKLLHWLYVDEAWQLEPERSLMSRQITEDNTVGTTTHMPLLVYNKTDESSLDLKWLNTCETDRHDQLHRNTKYFFFKKKCDVDCRSFLLVVIYK